MYYYNVVLQGGNVHSYRMVFSGTLYSPTMSSATLSSPESCPLPFDTPFTPFTPFTALESPLTLSPWVCEIQCGIISNSARICTCTLEMGPSC